MFELRCSSGTETIIREHRIPFAVTVSRITAVDGSELHSESADPKRLVKDMGTIVPSVIDGTDIAGNDSPGGTLDTSFRNWARL